MLCFVFHLCNCIVFKVTFPSQPRNDLSFPHIHIHVTSVQASTRSNYYLIFCSCQIQAKSLYFVLLTIMTINEVCLTVMAIFELVQIFNLLSSQIS
jgi:hypothetical protein